MPSSLNKIQLRAKIISVLNSYREIKTIDTNKIENDIQLLKELSCDDFLAQVLFKEILSDDKAYADVCANIALGALSLDVFKKHGIQILEDTNVSDSKKFYFISLLEHKGIRIDYDNLEFYIKDPVQVANEGINEFLNDTLINLESRIDLLDFYNNIPFDERMYLIENLAQEYDGEILACSLLIISYVDKLSREEIEYIVELLLKTDCYYTYKALKHIELNYEISSFFKLKAETYLKNNEFKYNNKSDSNLLSNSIPYKCYISFVDGNSNFSLVFVRKYEDNLLSVFFTTINITLGITSCIGFNHIQEDYFDRIFKRLFVDSVPVLINPFVFKGFLDYYSKVNTVSDFKLPYEFYIWEELSSDLNFKEKDFEKYIKSNLSITSLNKIKFDKIIKSKLIENWYFLPKQISLIDSIIQSMLEKHIVDLTELNEIILSNTSSYMEKNPDFVEEIKSRLILESYVAQLGKFNISSSVMYSVANNPTYLKDMIIYFVYKSIYVYLLEQIIDMDKNMFKKENKKIYTKREMVKLVKDIESKFE